MKPWKDEALHLCKFVNEYSPGRYRSQFGFCLATVEQLAHFYLRSVGRLI
jgi:hypothetical protein